MPDKNTGPFLAFTSGWFRKHQRGLLFLCNAPVIKYWFRYVLRIHKFDCPIDVKITALAPNSFTYGNKTVLETCAEYRKHFHGAELKKWNRLHKKMDCNGYHFAEKKTTDFRTHPKFAKRVYYAFKPMWWAFHAWDWLVADRFVPAWSFGFTTLTTYPGSIGADNPVDGYMYQGGSGSTWGTLVAAAGSNAPANAGLDNIVYYQANTGTANWLTLLRSIYCFDTSTLTASATISAVTMSIYGGAKSDSFSTPSIPNINIYSSAPAATNALAAGDYDSLGSTAYCDTAVSYSGWSTTGYNDFAFNATGISAISKTGITPTGARNANHDVANSAPTFQDGKSAELDGYFSNQGGTSNDPKLVVTYTAVTDLSVSVFDSITVAENISADDQLNPSVSDTVIVAEAITTDNQLNPNVFDSVAVAEVVSGQMNLGDISVFDAVSIAEAITAQMDLGDISVFDTVTLAESITLESDIFQDVLSVSVFDGVAISEETTSNIDLGDISVFDTVTVDEALNTDLGLGDISVFDTVSVAEDIGIEFPIDISVVETVTLTESITLLVTARRDGWIVNLRSEQQKYPLSMDESDTIKMRSYEQSYPKSMDTTDIL